jgi:hypothetical protein
MRLGLALLPFVIALLCLRGNPVPDDPLKTGLTLWRKPDKLGHACASCHSADGIELAAFAYDGVTIRRRATPHLGPADADLLAAYFEALRKHLGIDGHLDPMLDRPLQPGGAVLPGRTAEERDRSFALSLAKQLPVMMGNPITNLAQAKKALSEVLALDPSRLRIGLTLNRLSEDKFHGDEHASLAHWIPDEAPLPFSPGLAAAEDRYLGDPSESNLRALEAFYDAKWSRSLSPSQAIALEKARSLLLYQHALRTRQTYVQTLQMPDPMKAPTNAFWELGELARIYTNSQASGLALPPDVQAKKSGGPSLRTQMQDMRLPWLWLGWMIDPGLQRTSYDRRTRYADWFSQLLLEDGPYPTHAAVMLTVKMAKEAFDKNAWASAEPQHLDINFSWLLRGDNWKTYSPRNSMHRAAFYRFLANSFRKFALLQADEIGRTGVTYMRDPVIQQLDAMRAANATMDPDRIKMDAPLFRDAISAVRTAKLATQS